MTALVTSVLSIIIVRLKVRSQGGFPSVKLQANVALIFFLTRVRSHVPGKTVFFEKCFMTVFTLVFSFQQMVPPNVHTQASVPAKCGLARVTFEGATLGTMLYNHVVKFFAIIIEHFPTVRAFISLMGQ